MELEVKIAQSDSEIEAVKNIRQKIFIDEQGIPEEMEFDEHDKSGIHFIALFNNVAIGTARIAIVGDGIAKGSRLAILKEYRNRNVGMQIMRSVGMIARIKGIKKIIIEPHSYLEKYYSYFGFVKVEGSQSFGEIELIRMEIEL